MNGLNAILKNKEEILKLIEIMISSPLICF